MSKPTIEECFRIARAIPSCCMDGDECTHRKRRAEALDRIEARLESLEKQLAAQFDAKRRIIETNDVVSKHYEARLGEQARIIEALRHRDPMSCDVAGHYHVDGICTVCGELEKP